MWSARVADVVASEDTGRVIVIVAAERKDDQGVVVESSNESWTYPSGSAPTPETIGERLRELAARKTELSATRDPLFAMIGMVVEVPDVAPIFPEDVAKVSKTDQAVISMKNTIKPILIEYIQANPACVYQDVLGFIQTNNGAPYRGLVEALTPIYVQGAFGAGLISDATFPIFRDWIVATPKDILLGI
jgi:hypothetical protein